MRKPVNLVAAKLAGATLTIVGVIPALPPHVREPPLGKTRWVRPFAKSLSNVRAPGRGAESPDEPHAILVRNVDGALAPPLAGRSPAVLFESMTYDLYLEWSDGHEWKVSADVDGLILEVRTWKSATGALAHYRLEVGNDVGILGVNVSRASSHSKAIDEMASEIGRLEIEVFPRKLDYQTDYREMIADVARITPALIFEVSGRTALPGSLRETQQQSSRDWYEILRAVVAELLYAIDLVTADPQKRLQPVPRWVATEKARRVSAVGLARSLRKAGNVAVGKSSPLGNYWPRKVVEVTYAPSFDAEGNRYVRALLSQVLLKLNQLEGQLLDPKSTWYETQGGSDHAARWLLEVRLARPEVRRRLNLDWVSSAGELRSHTLSSTVQAHPLYAHIASIGRSLLRGLNIEGPRVTDATSRTISSLYEHWCFLAILQALRRHSLLEQCSDLQLLARGSRISIRRGQAGAAVFRHRATGKRLYVYYNREYETPTISQRPDASIHIETQAGIHVFDAKYRIQFDAQYKKTYGGVGPRVDDISTMHRYRDAIVRSSSGGKYDRLVNSACVLFPWNEQETFGDHPFALSLRSVGVGGLPFLPSCTALVEQHLDAIVQMAVIEVDS